MSNQIFHFSNTGETSGQRFYLKDGAGVSGIFVNNLPINSNSPIEGSNLVYTTGDQTISGTKIFSTGNGAYLKSENFYTNSPSLIKISDNNNLANSQLNILYINSTTPFETTTANTNTTGIKIFWNFTNNNQEELSRHIRTQMASFQTGVGVFGPWVTAAENVQNATGIIITGHPNLNVFARALISNYPLENRLKHIEKNGVFSLLSGEKMGIGIHNPEEKLHVVGNLKLDGELQTSQIINGSINGNANTVTSGVYSQNVNKIITLSQTDYDNLSPNYDPGTMYIII